MKHRRANLYERAFENWLIDNKVRYIAIDEHKKKVFGRSKIKSFDFLLNPPAQRPIIAEIKGRVFKGKTLVRLAGLQCWVTSEDVDGLAGWQQVFGSGYVTAFVFAYRVASVDVDFDGRDYYDFAGQRYVFFAVKLDDYRRFMTLRSPRWRTVTLPAEKFRLCAVQMQKLVL